MDYVRSLFDAALVAGVLKIQIDGAEKELETMESTITAQENKIYELEDKERQLVDMIDAREDYIDVLEEGVPVHVTDSDRDMMRRVFSGLEKLALDLEHRNGPFGLHASVLDIVEGVGTLRRCAGIVEATARLYGHNKGKQ